MTVSHTDEVAEWLRRWTANPLCFARVGSNPILVAREVLGSIYNTNENLRAKYPCPLSVICPFVCSQCCKMTMINDSSHCATFCCRNLFIRQQILSDLSHHYWIFTFFFETAANFCVQSYKHFVLLSISGIPNIFIDNEVWNLLWPIHCSKNTSILFLLVVC